MLRLFESPLSEESGQDFTSMNNCMWNMVITLTSAGYGELYPKTFFGRIVGVTICFWGVLIISLMVVAVTQTLEFDENELKSYDLLMRLHYKKELKKDAIQVLIAAYAHRNVKRNNPDNKELILKHFRAFRSQMLKFNRTMRLIRSLDNGGGKNLDVMQTILDSLTEVLKVMGKQQRKTIKKIGKIYEMLEENRDLMTDKEASEFQSLET